MAMTLDRPVLDRDAELLEALRRRDASAAERLISTFGDRAYRLALGITGNREDAEEAVQDAFWNVIREIDTFRGDSAFGSWVYRITANAAYYKLRRGAQRGVEMSLDSVLPVFDKDGEHAGVGTDLSSRINDPAIQRELQDALRAAIDALPADYRAVIVPHDIEGLPLTDVADSLGLSVPTVKSRIHRARVRLRHRLARFMTSEPDRGHSNRDVVAVAAA